MGTSATAPKQVVREMAQSGLADSAFVPMKRHAEPQEMAGTVLYLVSGACSYTH